MWYPVHCVSLRPVFHNHFMFVVTWFTIPTRPPRAVQICALRSVHSSFTLASDGRELIPYAVVSRALPGRHDHPDGNWQTIRLRTFHIENTSIFIKHVNNGIPHATISHHCQHHQANAWLVSANTRTKHKHCAANHWCRIRTNRIIAVMRMRKLPNQNAEHLHVPKKFLGTPEHFL